MSNHPFNQINLSCCCSAHTVLLPRNFKYCYDKSNITTKYHFNTAVKSSKSLKHHQLFKLKHSKAHSLQRGQPVPRRSVLPKMPVSFSLVVIQEQPPGWSRCPAWRWLMLKPLPGYHRTLGWGRHRWPGWSPGLPQTWPKPKRSHWKNSRWKHNIKI